ncbi:AAA family ATPase [Faecalibacillus intestinalis]|uniref:AAA family ATPase n=1 Tax=Faecalibacillus intestinalis TaxID=1982626 RepID=UPI00399522D3
MIKKISINKLGRFNKFYFDNVNEFKRFNILYGWNYSGKTTLSRAFMTFDTKKIPEHYENGFDFTLIRNDGSSLNPNNETDINSLQTKVFNYDYVENNLFFKDTGASNILVLADNAQETMTKIEELSNEINLRYKDIIKFKEQQTEYQTYLENKRSDESRKIKNNLHCTFTANTFQSYERKLKQNDSLESYIIENDDELCKKRSIAIAEKNKENIEAIPPIPIIDIDKLKDLLNETVSIKSPLERLSNNKEAEKWVREGLTLHQNTDTCFYCGNPLNENIINELNAHFDKSFNDLISKIEFQQNNIKTITSFNNLPDTSKFYEQFENKYLKDREILEEQRKQYNRVIKKIQELLSNKLKSVTQPLPFDIDYDFTSINTQIENINNGIIKEHNVFNENFDKQKEAALEELRKHYVAEIIIGKDFTDAEKAVNDAKNGIEKSKKEIEEKEKDKKLLEAQISESVSGAEKVNIILNRLFMGKSEIELAQKSPVETEKYILKRNGEPAHNLSEGEKTAISFAHFLASLESKDLINKYGEIILYIDDPISSLDNNHIYAIYSEIDRLKREECSSIVGSDKKKYKQLFISTHNYHLFRLLTDKEGKNIGVYYIQRNKQDSIITNFPEKILQQKAEYSFLFHQIKKYIENPQEEDYIMGHFLRRFLEIFATYKNPTKNELRKRLEQIVDLKPEYKANETIVSTVYKTVNDESHTYITNEVINNGSLKNTAKYVLEFIKMVDPDQYSFLEKNYST